MTKEDLMRIVSGAGIVSVLSGVVRALLTKNEPLMQRIKVFIAGICMGILVAILLQDVPVKEFWKNIIVASATGYVSSIWPLLEGFVLKYIKRKSNDIVKDINTD